MNLHETYSPPFHVRTQTNAQNIPISVIHDDNGITIGGCQSEEIALAIVAVLNEHHGWERGFKNEPKLVPRMVNAMATEKRAVPRINGRNA